MPTSSIIKGLSSAILLLLLISQIQPQRPSAHAAALAPAARPAGKPPVTGQPHPAQASITTRQDAYGYTLADSLEPGGGCAPSFEDISATGTPLDLGDDAEANVTLAFTFTFYGVSSSNLRVGNNGGLLFGVTEGVLDSFNRALAVASLAAPAILPFWDDIDSDTGNVFHETRGAGPNRRFIVQWHNRPHFSNEGSATFQVILYEGSNNIHFVYSDVDFGAPSDNNGRSATVGIKQNHSFYLQYSHNAPFISDGLGICITAPPLMERYGNPTISADRPLADQGATVSYTTWITNTGDLVGSATTITAPLPLGTSYNAGSVGCSAGTCSYDSASNQVIWQGALPIGASVRIWFGLTVGDLHSGNLVVSALINDPASSLAPRVISASIVLVDTIYRYENFEDGPGGFVPIAPGEWEHGVPAQPSGPRANSGTMVWATDLDSDAADSIGHHYLTATLALPAGVPNLRLYWWDWHDAESLDTRRVLVNDIPLVSDSSSSDQFQWQMNNIDLSVWAGQTVTLTFDLQVAGVEPGPDGWYVDDMALVTEAFAGPALGPGGLSAYLRPEQAMTQTVALSNSGHLGLEWELYDPASPGAEVIHDNGPLYNSPGTGPGGSHQSILENSTVGASTLGFLVGPTLHLGEDLLVDDPAGWEIDTLTVYAYQIGTGSTTTIISATYLQIWDGPPFLPGSAIVFGDMATNRMLASDWSGVYRRNQSVIPAGSPIMRSVVDVGATLAPGRYWLNWRIESVSGDTLFAPPISIRGARVTGNAIQNSGGAAPWAYINDAALFDQQGLPFLVTGQRKGCDSPPAWLDLAATSGSVGAEGGAAIAASFDGSGLAPGVYTTTLCLTTNAPQSLLTVPVTLNVGLADLQISTSIDTALIQSGGQPIYTLSYTNSTPYTAWDVAITETVPLHTSFDPAASPGWVCGAGGAPGDTCARSLGDLAPWAAGSLDFPVQVAATLPASQGITNTVWIAERQFGDPTALNNQAELVTPVQLRTNGAIGLTIQQTQAQVGGLVTATLAYINTGPDTQASAVISASLPAELSLVDVQMNQPLQTLSTAPPLWQTGPLAPGSGGTIVLTLRVQPTAATSLVISAGIDGGSSEINAANNTVQRTVTLSRRLFLPIVLR